MTTTPQRRGDERIESSEVKLTRAQLSRVYSLAATHPYAVTIRDAGDGNVGLRLIGPEGEIAGEHLLSRDGQAPIPLGNPFSTQP